MVIVQLPAGNPLPVAVCPSKMGKVGDPVKRISCLILLLLCVLCACTTSSVEAYILDEIEPAAEYESNAADKTLLASTIDEFFDSLGAPFADRGDLFNTPLIPSYPEEFGGCFPYQETYFVILLTDLDPETVARYQSYVSHPEILRFMRSDYSFNNLIGVAYSIILRGTDDLMIDGSIELIRAYPQNVDAAQRNFYGHTGTEIGRVRVDIRYDPRRHSKDKIEAFYHELYGDRVVVGFYETE